MCFETRSAKNTASLLETPNFNYGVPTPDTLPRQMPQRGEPPHGTGSPTPLSLVFEPEINHWQINQQFGQVIPQEQRVSIETILNNVKTAYANQPNLKLRSIDMLPKNSIYKVQLRTPDDKRTHVFVNPYTGAIMGDRQRESSFWGVVFKLHYTLLAGETGEIIVGIAALLLLILSITGIILWPGWLMLIGGFIH